MDIRGAIMISAKTNDGLVILHLQYLRSIGRAEGTIRSRRAALQRLEQHSGCNPVGVTYSQVAAYLAMRRMGESVRTGAVVSDSTFANDVSHFRAFYSWLVRFEYRVDDPTSRVERGRMARTIVQPIPDQMLAEALNSADDADRVILCLAAFAGLRACEIADLAWSDIDGVEETIYVRRGKNGKPRIVPLTDPVREALMKLPMRSGWVIRRRDGPGKASPNLVSQRAIRILGGRKSGGHSLHQLRHRWATAAYRATKDLRAVQEGLGHSSPTTTAIYAKSGADALREASQSAAELQLSASDRRPRL